MAVNLLATAKLNTRPYMAGLRQISAGTASLNNAQVKGSQKVQHEVDNERKARIAGANAHKAAVAGQMAAQQKAQSQMMDGLRQGVSAQRYLYGDMARMTARAALGLTAFPIAAVAAGVAWERGFADVVRTADPAFSQSEAAVEGLRRSMVNMVQTMPTSWGELTEMATLANQMGIASAETAKFTQATAMFAATSGVSVDMTATAFGRLRTIVPDIGSDFMGLADSILKVGVNSVATEGEIINIVTQISSIAGAAQMTDKEMIGLAGALASVRVPPELSRGVVTRVFGQISRAVADGGAKMEGFARIAGMTGEEFAQSWGQKGKTGKAFVSFMDGLRELGPQAEAELRGLGITSVRDVPVMLRLANAADSEGVVGGLLKQTISDAENASGETQRQYTIMAQTVGAKLKVVGNNIMAFFSAISGSALGPLGNVLDFIANGIKDVTNSLDDSHKLFGQFDMPFTNAELIGTVATLGLIAAGFLAIGSAVLKAKEAFAGIQLLGSAFGRSGRGGDPTGVGRIGAQWAAFPAQVRRGMDRATAAAAQGYGRMAVLNERYRKSINPGNRNQIVYAGAGNTRRTVDSINVQRAAMANFQASANRTASGVSSAFSRVGSAVMTAGRGIGAAASFAFGPWGLLAGIALGVIGGFVESTRAASTEASDLAQEIASVGTNSAKAAEKMKQVTVGGLFGYENQIFKDGYKDLQKLNQEAAKARESTRVEVTPGNARFAASANAAKAMGDTQRISREFAESLGTIDNAFEELVNGGNSTAAVGALRKFAGTTEDLYSMIDAKGAAKLGIIDKNDVEEMEKSTSAISRAYRAAFESTGTELNLENLEKLSRGALPEVQAALYGVATAAGVTDAELDAIEGGDVAFAEMAKAAEDAAAAFINYSEAITNADGEINSLSGFTDELNEQIKVQQQWGENLAKVAKIGGSEAVNAFLGMGAEAAPILDQLVKDFENTGGSVDGAWKSAMDAILQSTDTTAGQAGVAMAASFDRMTSQLKNSDLVNALAGMLDVDQFTTLSRSFETLGKDAATSLAEGITSGRMSVEAAIVSATQASRPKIPVDPELDKGALTRVNAMLDTFAATNKIELPAGVKLDANTTVAEFRQIMGQPNLFPKIPVDTDISLVDAYAKYESVRTYMLANGIDIDVAANPALAYLSVDAFAAYANGTVTMATINALKAPAEGVLWEFVTLANGTTVAVQVNAETGLAIAGNEMVVAKVGEKVDKPVGANTADAKAAIDAVNEAAKAKQTKPVDVQVSDNGTAAAVQGKINSITGKSVTVSISEVTTKSTVRKADGGVMSYYANGGVRESHVAHIAPAGTMRTFAEPETGGEGYIPLAASKRKRSTAILSDIATRFGYSLVQGADVARFANGGQYQAQQISRAAPASVRDAFGGGLSVSDRQFFAHLFRTVVVTADSQAITGLTNDINTTNARFGR